METKMFSEVWEAVACLVCWVCEQQNRFTFWFLKRKWCNVCDSIHYWRKEILQTESLLHPFSAVSVHLIPGPYACFPWRSGRGAALQRASGTCYSCWCAFLEPTSCQGCGTSLLKIALALWSHLDASWTFTLCQLALLTPSSTGSSFSSASVLMNKDLIHFDLSFAETWWMKCSYQSGPGELNLLSSCLLSRLQLQHF